MKPRKCLYIVCGQIIIVQGFLGGAGGHLEPLPPEKGFAPLENFSPLPGMLKRYLKVTSNAHSSKPS